MRNPLSEILYKKGGQREGEKKSKMHVRESCRIELWGGGGEAGGCPRDLTDGAVTLSFRSNSVQPQPGLNPTRGERGATRTDDQREERGRKHKKGRERDCLERRKIDSPIYR